jgi:diguanylate cyclase (GGDEF)-like protein
MLAVVHLGLDRFGTVNKTLGFPTGDALLREVGERLQEAATSKAEVARFGGDEFVVLLSGVEDLGQSVGTVERMLDALRRPFFLGTEVVQVSASAGMALYPRDGETPEMLLQNAALAMERAKREGGNTYRLFTELLDKQEQRRLRLEAQLRRAVATGEFVLHYQPKVTADRGVPVGVEALLRWRDEEGRIVSPTEFIPLAEEIGEIGRLGAFALKTACRTALEWQRSGHDLVMAVNISPKQFAGDDLVDLVLDTLSRTGLDPTRLELEITESAFLENPTATVRAMEHLASRGVRFSLDDFGTGYSSLSYIRFLPLAGIKIDRTFMTDLAGERTRAIVSTMIHLARELRLELTMEGVETAKQLSLLRHFGSDFFVQGYLFSRPLPEADALAWIRTAAPKPDEESPREG